MVKFIVKLTDVEEKALLTEMKSIQDWIDNAIHNRARVAINKIVDEVSDKKVSTLSDTERYKIVRKAVVKTGAEKEQEFLNTLPIKGI